MKPDKNTCLNCGKEISLRAKYCSDKCRKQYERNSDKRSDKTNPDTQNSEVGQEPGQTELRDSLTKTDKTFYDRAMKEWGEPYYRFGGKLRSERCGFCQTPYKTTLALNRYCSYDHYKKATDGVLK